MRWLAYYLLYPLLFVTLRGTKRTRVIVTSPEGILLLKPQIGPGNYIFPGGGIKPSEPHDLAALRELREETGLTLSAQDLTFVGEYSVRSRGITMTAVLFTAKLTTVPKLTLQLHEIAEARWVSAHEIDGVKLLESERQLIRNSGIM